MTEQTYYKVDPMVIQTLKDSGEFDAAFFKETSIHKRKIENFINEKNTLIEYDTACTIAKELNMDWKMLIML